MKWLLDHASYSGAECLIWPFARHPDGRAHMKAGKPSRIMCELAHGPAPTPTHEAAHSCGKAYSGCVNPLHLRWATPKENAADKEMHGTVVRGERHYGTTLTEVDVRRIRSLRGEVLGRDLAEEYGVTAGCISEIQNMKSWRGAPNG
jgi:hypothetical protein